jgi:hypothetical protein
VSDALPDEKESPAIEISIRRYLTPEIIAGAFIRMNSREQAEVFHQIQMQAEELFKEGAPQMQWCYLAQDLKREGPLSPGWRFACDIGAFTMVHTYRLLEGREGRAV